MIVQTVLLQLYIEEFEKDTIHKYESHLESYITLFLYSTILYINGHVCQLILKPTQTYLIAHQALKLI